MKRNTLLREMGLAPLWRLRAPKSAAEGDGAAANEPTRAPIDVDPQSALSSPVPMPPIATQPVTTSPKFTDERTAHIADLEWEALEEAIRTCSACRLCEQRKQAVPGIGDRRAAWMLVGEGPGAEEDRRGEPFVGQAGKLLDAMLAAIGLRRGEGTYITNAVKCRPPHNRTPEADEIAACLPFLQRQIALIQPRVVLALGRPAALALLGTEVRISAVRGKIFHALQVPVVVTYHPAYLLRNPADKSKVWEDLCYARQTAAGTKPE